MSSTLQPDDSSRGFLIEKPVVERYGPQKPRPFEAQGMILKHIAKGSRVLDVGCGTGSMLSLLAQHRGAELVGLEPEADRAAIAREEGFDVREEALSPQLLDDIGTFDVVLFADVIEHLAAPVGILELAQRFLRKDGRILASIPNVAHWSVRLGLLAGRFDYQPYGILDATHLRWFTERTVRQVFACANLEIETLAMSAGTILPVYREARPWRWIPRKKRRRVVRWAARRAPRLFGCQFVVSAKPIRSDPPLRSSGA